MTMPTTYTRDSVLTPQQVAEALSISTDKLANVPIPAIWLGHRTKRYLWSAVLDYLQRESI